MSAGAPVEKPLSVAVIGRRMGREPESWKLWLGEFVDEFRRQANLQLVAEPPPPELPAQLRSLLASVVEALCAERGLPAPGWCQHVPPLPVPWFVAGMESLKAMALVESPAQFRQRNIFVLGNFLSRA